VETALLSKLSRCVNSSSVDCQLAVVRSLGNARLAGTVDALVQLAVSSKHAAVSEAALYALRRFDADTIRNSPLVSYLHRVNLVNSRDYVFHPMCVCVRVCAAA